MLIRDNRTGSENQVDTMRNTTTGIRVRDIRTGRAELPGVLVELAGELDVHDLESLRRTFDDTLSSGLPTYVDLSGVTFLDTVCARELAAQYRLYGTHGRLLTLRDPSWQVEASFRACG
jgi:anti-anti-sigma factor